MKKKSFVKKKRRKKCHLASKPGRDTHPMWSHVDLGRKSSPPYHNEFFDMVRRIIALWLKNVPFLTLSALIITFGNSFHLNAMSLSSTLLDSGWWCGDVTSFDPPPTKVLSNVLKFFLVLACMQLKANSGRYFKVNSSWFNLRSLLWQPEKKQWNEFLLPSTLYTSSLLYSLIIPFNKFLRMLLNVPKNWLSSPWSTR